MKHTINWGIIGPGNIAHKFARDLATIPDAKLLAVASRSEERARNFARAYHAPYAYEGYESITDCPGLDVVYIATPHAFHYENTIHCLNNGIAVLCEKPLAMNSRQVTAMIKKAKEKKVFLMEALWTKFMPSFKAIQACIGRGEIGEVLALDANFCFKANPNGKARIFEPALGGGALLDIGIYPAFLALEIFGEPKSISGIAQFTDQKVDEECSFHFEYPDNKVARLHASFRYHQPTTATIHGTKGSIHIPAPWHHTQEFLLTNEHGQTRPLSFKDQRVGYAYEAVEVMDCLRNGKTESSQFSFTHSKILMKTLDAMRKKIGLVYPADKVKKK